MKTKNWIPATHASHGCPDTAGMTERVPLPWATALKVMEEHSITALFVHKKGKSEEPVGVIRLHDLIKGGVI